jgi:hypothetical protein
MERAQFPSCVALVPPRSTWIAKASSSEFLRASLPGSRAVSSAFRRMTNARSRPNVRMG